MDKVEKNKKLKTKNQNYSLKFKILVFGLSLWVYPALLVFAEDLVAHGFLQTNYSARIADDNPQGAKQGNLIMGEERFQLKSSFYPQKSKIGFFVKSDFYHDRVEEDFNVDFRE